MASVLCTYFELRLRRTDGALETGQMSRLWHLVHTSAARSGIAYAVSFPRWMLGGFGFGDILRVFTADTTSAEALYDPLEQMHQAPDLADGSRVRRAPTPGACEAFLMHRIPSAVSKRRKTVSLERAQALREESLRRRIAWQQHLPFVRMRSSSGNAFRLVVERIAANPDQQGIPNGYGLSRASQIVALPVV